MPNEAPYIPNEYWIKEGVNYEDKFKHNKIFELQETMLIDYLKSIQFGDVLEIGCGFGRITRLLLSNFPSIRTYSAVDLSPNQIQKAKEYIKSVKTRVNVEFITCEVQQLQLDRKYDLVIASEVLMHVMSNEINDVMGKIVGLSAKNVINIDWYEEKTPRRIAPHNFIHQYEKIYKALPSVIQVNKIQIVRRRLLSKLDAKQYIFHAIVTE